MVQAPRRLGLAAQCRQGRSGGDHLGVHSQFDDRGAARGERRLEGRRELLGARDGRAERAIGGGERGKIRVPEGGADDPAGKAALLVHADRAVHRVVENQNDRGRAFGERRR
jgi:hypothetical protein